MADKGYVVRYTNERGTFYVAAPKWLDDYTIGTARTDEGVLFDALPAAVAASRHPRKVNTVTILAVAEDGTETPLPSYEDALAEIERLRSVAPILINGVPAIMHSSAPASREEIGAAACQMLKAIERALSVLQGSERMPSDPLAALEAAERRLLEAGGWRIEPNAQACGAERWERGVDNESRQVALTIERRRLAAKGGA